MASLAAQLGMPTNDAPMRDAFLGWQCRARQMMMRDHGGKPTDAITPALTLAGEAMPTPGQIDAMLKGAVLAAEQFYPAFQLVAWGDDTADQALSIAMSEAVGRA